MTQAMANAREATHARPGIQPGQAPAQHGALGAGMCQYRQQHRAIEPKLFSIVTKIVQYHHQNCSVLLIVLVRIVTGIVTRNWFLVLFVKNNLYNTLQYGRYSDYNYNITMLQYCTILSDNTGYNIYRYLQYLIQYCHLYCHSILYNIVTL